MTMTKDRPRIVPPRGSLQSRICLLGEAPGKWEHQKGRPFCGPSGQMVDRMGTPHGLNTNNMYIQNVYPYWPDSQGIKIGDLSDEVLAPCIDEVHQRLDAMPNLRVIVPTGNVALHALTGLKGITKWRGSILNYTTLSGREVKVIPTIHPAAIMRHWQWYKRTCMDWGKIAYESMNPGPADIPVFSHLIRPNLNDIQVFVDEAAESPLLSLDIETPGRDGVITCIGFSHEERKSLVIPTTKQYWGSKKKLNEAWYKIYTLCNLGAEKIMQNGLFDTWVLKKNYDIDVSNWRWDTLAMHTCLDPIDSHDLGYIASCYSNQPYWKDEGKQFISARRMTSRIESFWMYCGIDAAITFELQDHLKKALVADNLLDVYHKHYGELFAPCLDLSVTGIRVDEKRRRARFLRLRIGQHDAMNKLSEMAGRLLYAVDGLSTQRLAKWLYGKGDDDLGLTKLTNKEGGTTTDETAILRLLKKYKAKFRDAGNLILESRHKQKLASFLGPKTYCPDGRMRSTYTPFASTGRMRCKATPNGTGRNCQNTHNAIRDVYVPEEGQIFLIADLSQAESRIVQVLTGTDRMIERARRLPGTWDEHKFNASETFGITEEAVTKDQRQIGKRVTHSTNYDVGANTLSSALFLEGYGISPAECKKFIQGRQRAYPELVKWHQEIRSQIMNVGFLTNSWGRRMDFRWSRMSHDTYKEAYAFLPQSEIADLTNQRGFIPLWNWLRDAAAWLKKDEARIVAHMHDGLVISTKPNRAHEVATFLAKSLEEPREYDGVSLSVPVTFTLCPNWGTYAVEYDRLPSYDQMTDAAQQILQEMTT